jgi:hypothetical protein
MEWAKMPARIRAWTYALLALAAMLGAQHCLAQYDTGSLVGVIQDSSGAVVPGATVTVTNKATGAVFTATSGGAGEYEAPSLHTGTYKITAERSGFNTAVADNILVSVGVRQHIDLTLAVGQTATTVEVSDVALQLETDSSERGQTVSGYQGGAAPGEPQLL